MDIKEVAKRAKVSTATVSRVINNLPSVRPSTHAHVMRVIEKLNYVPNTSARYLRAGHTKLFGLIVSDIKNPFFPDLIDHFEAMATKHGIDVIFTHTHYDAKRLKHCLWRLVDRNVDGIAVMTSEVESHALERVKRSKVPLVLLNQAALDEKFNNIRIDYSKGFKQALQHLIGLGHRRIAFLSGPPKFSSAKRRLAAFLAGMKYCGLKVRDEWMFVGDLHVEGGNIAMQELLHTSPRPTAVLCSNDLMAIGALQACQAARLRVPKDISIIGFDDLPICTMVTPPLTTITLSRQEIAAYAFSVLWKASSPGLKTKLSRHIISPRLTVRNSTGPPA
jgi:LacI family transcriptional regulator